MAVKPGKSETQKTGSKRWSNWWFLAVVVGIYGIILLLDPKLGYPALAYFYHSLIRLLPFFGLMLLIMWLFNYFIRPQKIAKQLGGQSGLKGWLIAIASGVFSMGSMYLWYPLLADLNKHGLRPALAAAFLYSRAIKIPMLPFMVHYFGGLYTFLFVVFVLFFSVVSGVLVEKAYWKSGGIG